MFFSAGLEGGTTESRRYRCPGYGEGVSDVSGRPRGEGLGKSGKLYE